MTAKYPKDKAQKKRNHVENVFNLFIKINMPILMFYATNWDNFTSSVGPEDWKSSAKLSKQKITFYHI